MRLKVWQTQDVDNKTLGQAGTIVACSEHGFIVQTGAGLLHLLEVQPENKRKMAAQECLCGYCIHPGDMLS